MYSLRNSTKILPKLAQRRQSSTAAPQNVVSSVFTNRNPRNLEKLRIGYKPDGYHVDRPGKCYWHKLNLTASGRYVTATINHFENGEIIKTSTSEWAIKKQLYRTVDTSAYINLGRVLADRCLQSGILEVSCNIEPPIPNGKVALFLKAVEDGGVSLKEPPQYKPSRPWDQFRPEKPWEVTE
ncbi:39S ribosomal protein L18, mitochondrial [Anoplophora glabripennis]|uniref:Large ribosomal subunit protein uL18m n=1 Tax=Anoplophora glabripennis TaxID=217634 RepID=V5GRZ1_ANOGL|nr:39S ribosomal protein L18, mitochondrial [Anoplophora glabripennis]